MEVEDVKFEKEPMEDDDERLIVLSGCDTDTDDEKGAQPSAKYLGTSYLVIDGVRKYKKTDQRFRLTQAGAKIEETKAALKVLATKLRRAKVKESLLEEREHLLKKMEDWKKQKLNARNAVNQRRRQLRVRHKYGRMEKQRLDEKDKQFAKLYMEAYRTIQIGGGCEHKDLQVKNCQLCYARLLFGNLTCLSVKSEKAFEESQKPKESGRVLYPKIQAKTLEEVERIKKERQRASLQKFRERQKKTIQGMDERLKFFQDSSETFQKLYDCMPNAYKILLSSYMVLEKYFKLNCVRHFAEFIGVSIPKANIYLESEQFVEKFMDYLSKTFLLDQYCPIGFEVIEEEHCSQCDQNLPAVAVIKRFEDLLESYNIMEESFGDCQNCTRKGTLKKKRHYTLQKEESEYVLVCVPKGNIYFVEAIERIFNLPMELVFFISVAGHTCSPWKKVGQEWLIHLDGEWTQGRLPKTCNKVRYVVFKKRFNFT